MTLPLPNLDDHTYAELVEEARSLITNLYPEWTNHNPTDTGIILIELLAWLTEMKLYQINRVPDQNIISFLKLLNGQDWSFQDNFLERDQQTKALNAAIHKTLLNLEERYRAITCDDFEYLTMQKWPQTPEAKALGEQGKVKRSHCIAQRNLTLTDPKVRQQPAPGNMSLIVVPDLTNSPTPKPTQALCQSLWKFLDERRLLTTQHHIVEPQYVPVKITAKLFLVEDALPDKACTKAVKDICQFFHPLTGGSDGQGWPFGRDIYVSEVYQLLENIPEIDYVEAVKLHTQETWRLNRAHSDTLMSVTLYPDELVTVKVDKEFFEINIVSSSS
ncbi:baseplate protein J [Nostoc sp. ChiVER01]|uniref:baseplate protein J n=1 Tax=Nostoc sp. ChiVER01 TaxID=3075382 RepID=UPI002AD4EDAE|nr:baseplate protein J [Nostoc sp. ChiVER01]MDZ8228190.1 baseplate protein J [Nostoc sp. ChiVER01]